MNRPLCLFRRRLCSSFIALLLFACCALASPARAGIYTVTTIADTGNGSLRDAITNANINSSADTIVFSSLFNTAQTITLGGTQLPTITHSLTIQGPGANLLTISGNNQSRVFQLNGNGTEVAINALTITKGNASTGGGISNGTGTLTITESAVTHCTTSGSGAGIINVGGTLTLVDSTLSDNSASGASPEGGGIFNNGGTTTVTNSTLNGNSALDGGGLFNNGGTTTFTNSTLSNNSVSGNGSSGGGIYNNGGTVNLGNTILKTGTGGANIYSIGGTINSQGNNLSDDAANGGAGTAPGGYLNHSGDIRNTDPQFAAAGLTDNGGPTQTIALQSTSPAINAGSNALIPADTTDQDGDGNTSEAIPFDQRGTSHARKIGANVDIGAYEFSTYTESLVVTTTADEDNITTDPSQGTGTSLREVLNYANGLTTNPTITFNLGNTAQIITLGGTQLPTITKALTIQGPGSALLTISGNNQSRVFQIGRGAKAAINALTITQGSADLGGGIYNNDGTLTLTESAVTHSVASESGGGIYNNINNTLTITNSTLSNNSGSGNSVQGGGIFNNTGTTTITNSTLNGNSADDGAGVFNNFGGTLTISNSTLSTNSASGNSPQGGGIFNNAGTTTITNSTLNGNSANDGGGLFNNGGTTTISNSTLSNNSVSGNNAEGGGIYNNGGTLNLGNTILKTGTGGANIFNSGNLNSQGNNLSDDAAGGSASTAPGGFLTHSGDIRNTDPQFAAAGLTDNGGPTQTIALKSTSPAINAGSNALIPADTADQDGDNNTSEAVPYDQRGVGHPRKVGGTVDIGAYEFSVESLVVTTTADEDDGTSDANTGTGTSLREAINYANTLTTNPTITFSSLFNTAQTITLGGTQLPVLAKSMTVQGPGARLLTVSGNNQSRVFEIASGTQVTISGLTVTGGNAIGGGIANRGTLTLSNSTVSGNTSPDSGGGIFNNTGTLTLISSTVSGNSGYSGAGILSFGTLTLLNSTLSGNMASHYGGGIYNGGTLTFSNNTLSGNSAPSGGGGLYNAGGTVTLGNTIFKTGAQGANLGNNNGTITSQGNNLSNDAANGDNTTAPGGYLNHSGDIRNTDPQFAAAGLTDNGGPTQTIALQSTSPAINAGNNALIPADTADQDGDNNTGEASPFDQRGVGHPRKVGGTVDIGAYESSVESLVVTTTADEDDGTSDANTGTGTSLREAINYANTLNNNPIITFNLGNGNHTITLGSSLSTLAKSMTIQGPGANLLTLSGGGANSNYRLFNINSALTIAFSGLTFTGSRITNGGGGVILNTGSSVIVSNCAFIGNAAPNSLGGAIYNRANNRGGGGTATLTASNCTFNGNSAVNGGAIENYGIGGTATTNLGNCTFSGNSSNAGGAIFNYGANGTAPLNVKNCTFSDNAAGNAGGAIYALGTNGSGAVNLGNTILNVGTGSTPTLYNSGSTINSLGNNISSDDESAYLNQSSDQNNTDPKLAATGLTSTNGGPTATIALQATSPAINAGSNALIPADSGDQDGDNNTAEASPDDQRGTGFSRIQGTQVDIGAYEYGPFTESLVVTTTSDEDNGTSDPSLGSGTSLREAINYANTLSNTPTITFNLGTGAHTINLASALPNLSKNMKIQGLGAGLLTVRRSTAQNTPAFRIFTIDNVTTTLSDLTISNGQDTSSLGGGGIFNVGTLTLTGCVLSDNKANNTDTATGGGLFTQGKTILNTCMVINNTITSTDADNDGGSSEGGGIFSTAMLTLNNCTLSGNQVISNALSATGTGGNSNGGGIYATGSTVTIANCTLSNNKLVSNGGSTSGNGGVSQGGGIFTTSTLNLYNSTLTGNTTAAGAGSNGGTTGTSQGGALAVLGSSTTVRNGTFNNNAAATGGAIYAAGGTVNLGNTLLKSGAQGANLVNNGGTITSAGHNLSNDDGGGFLSGNGDQINTAPKLDPAGLKNNGGPTQTIALQSGSPAVDGGSNALIPPDSGDQDGDGNKTEPAPDDQRGAGFPRIQAGTVDIGAYEAAGPSLAINDVSGDEGNSGNTAFAFTVTLSRSLPTATTVHYATANDTANAGSDYTAKSGTLTIPANTLTGTITIQVTGDTARESDESFVVNLSNPTNATISDAQGVGTITNDDFEADLQLTQTAPAQVTTNSNITFTLSVKNNGPDTATNVVVSDTLPANATFESSNPVATTNSNGVLTFNLGTLTSTSSRSISITVQAPGTNGSVTNTASVSQSGSTDTSNSNNTSIKTVQVVASVQNVTAQTRIQRGDYSSTGSYSSGLFKPNGVVQTVKLTNTSGHDLQGPLSLVLDHLQGATLSNSAGKTSSSQSPSGSPYVNVSVGKDGIWSAGETVSVQVKFNKKPNTYTPRVLAGPGAR